MESPFGNSLITRVLPELEDMYRDVQRSRLRARLTKEIEGYKSRFNGTYRWSWNNDHYPAILFAIRDFPVTTTVWPQDPNLERLNIQFSFTNPTAGAATLPFPLLRLSSPQMISRGGVDLRMKRIQLRDTVLDASFVCQAQEDYAVRSLLTPHVKKKFLDLHYMIPWHSLSLALVADRLLIKKQFPRDLFTEGNLALVCDHALELLDQLCGSLRIEFVDPALTQLIQVVIAEKGASCRICGEPIFLDMVSCKSCETPHHRDCWEYAGNCAMYGCGEQAFFEGAALPAQEPEREIILPAFRR